jgi:carbamate kinase
MRIVVALGGNALLRRGEPAEADLQRARVLESASALSAIAREHELVLTHGNGPQVGLLALEAAAYDGVEPYPLDVLGAESQGMIGYLLAQAVAPSANDVAAVLTQVVVDPEDPAFRRPTKPIGPVYPDVDSASRAGGGAWKVARDGESFRRVVASPKPQAIVELDVIRRLLEAGMTVVCAGGGGIPVIAEGGSLTGVEAVIDKDLTAALLAEELVADRLVIATDVDAVYRDWGSTDARPIVETTPAELRRLEFAPGSMAPKVEAVCRFVERTDRPAVIGSLSELERLVDGRAGTTVVPTAAVSSAARHVRGKATTPRPAARRTMEVRTKR